METNLCPAMQIRGIDGFSKLPGIHGGGTDITHLSHAHDIIQGFQSLLDGRFIIPAMDLVEIHVIRLQAAQEMHRSMPGCVCAKVLCRWGPVPSGRTLFVAITRSSRRANSIRARPTTSSLFSTEYMSAVSKKLMPNSNAFLMNGWLCSSGRAHCQRSVGLP